MTLFFFYLFGRRADYYRYQVEVNGEESGYREKAEEAYNEATTLALDVLSPTNSVRLGLLLNRSVFLFEIIGDRIGACDLVKDTINNAIQVLDDIPSERKTEVTLILQLLRDNLTIWTIDDANSN